GILIFHVLHALRPVVARRHVLRTSHHGPLRFAGAHEWTEAPLVRGLAAGVGSLGCPVPAGAPAGGPARPAPARGGAVRGPPFGCAGIGSAAVILVLGGVAFGLSSLL